MDIAEFLAARLDEDEERAQNPQWGDAHGVCYECGTSSERLLREVAAKRKLIQRYRTALAIRKDELDMGLAWLYGQMCDEAAIWDTHPDYDPSWRP